MPPFQLLALNLPGTRGRIKDKSGYLHAIFQYYKIKIDSYQVLLVFENFQLILQCAFHIFHQVNGFSVVLQAFFSLDLPLELKLNTQIIFNLNICYKKTSLIKEHQIPLNILSV